MMKFLKWIGVGLFCIVAGVSTCALIFEAMTVDVELTESDHQLLLRTVDLEPWFDDWQADETLSEVVKLRLPDGSFELSYLNDSIDIDGPFLDVVVNRQDLRETVARCLRHLS